MSAYSRTQQISHRVIQPAGIVAGLSILLALFAIFTLADWAELSTLHHAEQHVLLFLAGTGFGGSLLALLKGRKQ